MAQDLLELLRHPEPREREIAARLSGRLDAAAVRPELERLCSDSELGVHNAAVAALDRLRPDGGGGNEIIKVHGGYGGLKALYKPFYRRRSERMLQARLRRRNREG